MSSIKYRPEIDGLRAIAVIPVILFHMRHGWIPGGFIGVDVFFVISGFLISSIIIEDHYKGIFSFTKFWLRRVRRIGPALLVMLISTSIAGYFVLFGSELRELGIQGCSVVFSVANIVMWRLEGNYWGVSAEESPLLHTWSLSVEEQFYFIVPFILILLLRHSRRRAFFFVLTGTAASFLLAVYGSKYYVSSTFYLLPTRAWELASGCLLALCTCNRPTIASLKFRWLATGGLVAIIASYLFVSGDSGFPGLLALPPVIGAILVIAFSAAEGGTAKSLLSFSPMVYIGKISYSLYLWHWPVLVLANALHMTGHERIASPYLLTLIFVLAIASYHLIEQTFRKRKGALAPILCAAVISLTISFFLYKKDFSVDISAYGPVELSVQVYDISPARKDLRTDLDGNNPRMRGITVPARPDDYKDVYASGGIIKKYGGETPQIMLLGDSHALMWAKLIDNISRELGKTVSFYAASGGTPPYINFTMNKERSGRFSADEKSIFDRARVDCIKRWKPKAVIIVCRWDYNNDEQKFSELIEFIVNSGSRVLLFEQPPILCFGDQGVLEALALRKITPRLNRTSSISIRDTMKEDWKRGNELARRLASRYDKCEFVPLADIYMANDSEAWVLDGTQLLYADDDHLSVKGTYLAESRIKRKIQEMLEK